MPLCYFVQDIDANFLTVLGCTSLESYEWLAKNSRRDVEKNEFSLPGCWLSLLGWQSRYSIASKSLIYWSFYRLSDNWDPSTVDQWCCQEHMVLKHYSSITWNWMDAVHFCPFVSIICLCLPKPKSVSDFIIDRNGRLYDKFCDWCCSGILSWIH